MYHKSLRFDIWLCLALSVLIAMGTGKLAAKILPQKYADLKAEHQVNNDEIGGKASENIFRATSVSDLLNHETFTVISPGIEYRNKGAGFYQNFYLYALTLPSGEIVAARINTENVIHDGDTLSKGDSILPVGKIVKEDLSSNPTFLSQIEYKEPLTRTDFYIDMVGNASIISEENYVDNTVTIVQVLTVIIAFPLIHLLGSKYGIFPYIFPPKE